MAFILQTRGNDRTEWRDTAINDDVLLAHTLYTQYIKTYPELQYRLLDNDGQIVRSHPEGE